MHVEDLKYWQWMFIGILLGAIYAGLRMTYEPPYAQFDVINQTRDFESQLAGTPLGGKRQRPQLVEQYHKGQPLLKDLQLHQPLVISGRKSYWVTGKQYSIESKRKDDNDPKSARIVEESWTPFVYEAPTPYTGMIGAPGSFPSIVQYMNALTPPATGKVPLREAWWEAPKVTFIAFPLAGFLMIGVALPTSIRLLQRAGLARAPQEKRAKLPKPRKANAAKAAFDQAAANLALESYNADLEGVVANFGGSAAEREAADEADAPIKPLAGNADLAPTLATGDSSEPVEYGGEFYPVVKPHHHE